MIIETPYGRITYNDRSRPLRLVAIPRGRASALTLRWTGELEHALALCRQWLNPWTRPEATKVLRENHTITIL